MRKKILINNQIRASKVRLIDAEGKQLGVFNLQEAIQKAREAGLDLIQATERVEPPVCKIMDYGKYAYQLSKKERKTQNQRGGGIKNIRLTFGISQHDLEIKARAAGKLLGRGDKIRVEMLLQGREKSLGEFAQKKIYQFLEILKQLTPIKIERDLKREARGLSMIIVKTT